MNRLLEIGFEKVGHWQASGGKLSLHLSRMESKRNILYAFVCDGEVKYIGKTKQRLASRMSGYRSPGATQSTNISNNARILEVLREGGAVDIFALPDDDLLHYGAFHLNLAAGLEDDLIRVLDPDWNGGSERVSPSFEPQIEERRSESDEEFNVILEATYYRTGFFNVRVAHENLFGGDGEPIELHVPGSSEPILGTINRTANSNTTPRIMGGTGLRDWFQWTGKVKDEIRVTVLSPNSIRFSKPQA